VVWRPDQRQGRDPLMRPNRTLRVLVRSRGMWLLALAVRH
jgi:hypothetical protein